MLIRYLTNGVEQHVQNQLGRSLIAAGLAQEIPPKGSLLDQTRARLAAQMGSAPALEPKWAVVTEPYADLQDPNKHVLAIRMDLGKQTSHFFGYPDQVNAKKEWDGGCRYLNGFGREVPEEIAKEYRRQWKANKHLRAPDDVLSPPRDERNDLQASILGRH